MAAFTLADLEARVAERASASPDDSYTATLLAKGHIHCARKMGEEAIETVIAATAQDDAALVAESADLLFHLCVVWRARGVALAAVMDALASRTARSGHDEKNARPKG